MIFFVCKEENFYDFSDCNAYLAWNIKTILKQFFKNILIKLFINKIKKFWMLKKNKKCLKQYKIIQIYNPSIYILNSYKILNFGKIDETFPFKFAISITKYLILNRNI